MHTKRLLPLAIACLVIALVFAVSFVHLRQSNAPARQQAAAHEDSVDENAQAIAPKVADFGTDAGRSPHDAAAEDARSAPAPATGVSAKSPPNDPAADTTDKPAPARSREEEARALMEEFIKRMEDDERALAEEPPLASFSGMVRDAQFNGLKSAYIKGSYEVTLQTKDGRSLSRVIRVDLAVSDANGFYHAKIHKRDLPSSVVVPERIELSVFASHVTHLLPEPVKLSLSRGEARTGVDLVMTQGGELAGRCVDERGNALAFVRVQFTHVQIESSRSRRPIYFEGVSDEKGCFAVSGLAEGEYRLETVSRAGWRGEVAPRTHFNVALSAPTDTGVHVLTRVTSVFFKLDFGTTADLGGGAKAGGNPSLTIEQAGQKTPARVVADRQGGELYVAELKDVSGAVTLFLKIPGYKIPDNPEGRFEVHIRQGEHHDLGTIKPQWDAEGQPGPPRRAR